MLITCTSAPGTAVTELSQNGITVTFEEPIEFSTSVLGEYFVEPCVITAYDPAWSTDHNGAMINPDPTASVQGYDNRTMTYAYSAGSRAAVPIELTAGQSLIITKGKATPVPNGGATRLSSCMILTCVASLPDPGEAFRPPYAGTDKTIWTLDDVDFDLLPGLAVPSGATLIDMSASGDYLNKTWLSHGNKPIWLSQVHPEDHMGGATASSQGYGMEMAKKISQMLVMSILDTPTAESIATRLVQYGIDQQANMAGNVRTWAYNGGHGWGRKGAILFAKTLLGETWTIPYYVTGSSGELKFQEDSYTYEGDTDPRWGEDCAITDGDFAQSNHSCRSSDGTEDQYALTGAEGATQGGYEVSAGARSLVGTTLAMREMGLQVAWGHDPAFDYADRWVDEISGTMGGLGLMSLGNSFQIDSNRYGGTGNGFMQKMWEEYR